MKISLWVPTPLRVVGGGTNWAVDVALTLADQGHKVDIISAPLVVRRGWPMREFPTRPIKSVSYSERWLSTIEDSDVVYIMYSPLWRLVKVKAPMIAGIHTAVFYQNEFVNPVNCLKIGSLLIWFGKLYYSLLSTKDFKKFTLIHIINKLAMHISHPSKFMYIPNWIDTDLFRPKFPKNNLFSVLFVGGHTWGHGWDRFYSAAVIISRKLSGIRFYSTGQSQGPVSGLGFLTREKLAEIYPKCHVLILPDRSNVFPLRALEALSSGTLVVASQISTHLALQLPLIYATSTLDIARAIVQLYDIWRKSPEKFSILCEKSRKLVFKYDKRVVFPRFVEMLKLACSLGNQKD